MPRTYILDVHGSVLTDEEKAFADEGLEFWFIGKGCERPRQVNQKAKRRNRRRRHIAKQSRRRNRN